MGSVIAGVALAAFASVLFNAAIVLQASEARDVPDEHGLRLSLIGRLLKRPRWLIGAALGAMAFPLQTVANLWAPLTAVQPADAAGLLVLLFLGARVLHERVGRREIVAVACIIVGIVILTLAAPKREVTQVDGADVLVPMAIVALIALAPLVFRKLVGADSIAVVLGAGFAFALSAFCAKVLADSLDRHAWFAAVVFVAVAGGGAFVGTLTEQTALQRRQATQVAPIIFAVELLVPVALAVLVVGEDWERESLVGILAALALVVGGAFTLARTPTVARMLEAGPWSSSRSSWRGGGGPLILLAILVAGAVLRFATLSNQSFWLDEAIAIDAARHSLGGLFDSLAHTEGNPPLYFLLLDGWMRLFGDSEAAVRSLSALFGTAMIVVTFLVGRRLATVRVGLVLAALVAFNPLLVWFSQEARPYALLVLLAGLSFLFFAQALEKPTGRALGAWAAASGLALATHYFAALLIVPEVVWLIVRVRPRRRLVPAFAGLALVFAALIPLVATQGQVQDYSFVKGESLATRLFAQVPKQWLVGYDGPPQH